MRSEVGRCGPVKRAYNETVCLFCRDLFGSWVGSYKLQLHVTQTASSCSCVCVGGGGGGGGDFHQSKSSRQAVHAEIFVLISSATILMC